ncbi:MAG TPA: hypothetical protein DCZ97_13180 [Syntrophus sp. (in: bacteria)]|nr:hypothetical protein [Syntrophus sp. (in: bacteria)]
MEFTLKYSGSLKANAGKDEKHLIRQAFHEQMKELWNHEPLASHIELKDELVRSVGSFRFLPLVSVGLAFTAGVSILMLREGTPGNIFVEGGDIDNRLKTLFDSLRMPSNVSELPKNISRREGEDPFYCLLEDDNLITSVTVDTDRLLIPLLNKSHVEMFLRISIRKHKDYIATSGII